MSRFFIFFAIMVAIVGGIHAYIWVRLVRDTALPQPWRLVATLALLLLALWVPASFFIRRTLEDRALASLLVWPAMVWLGVMFVCFCVLLATDVMRLAVLIAGARPSDPGRRLFLARLWGGVIASATAAATGVALVEATRVRVKELRVPLRRLPAALDGTTIVQITDVHIGPTLGRGFLEEVVARVNALEPDIVAITGDLVDGSVEELGDAVRPLAGLRARHGVYFVTGNHEYYSGVNPWLDFLRRLGVKVLRNERVTIGAGADSFDLAGVDDFSSKGMAPGHDGPDLAGALAGRDPERELVLLAHQPRAVAEAAHLGVGLQLSGHTHGGQVWPFKYLVYLQQPFVAGLAREKDTWIYVSCGTGFWGPPMRLLAPPEITRVVLTVPRAA
jgi:predicted MPP superfamily phosphohydrolase